VGVEGGGCGWPARGGGKIIAGVVYLRDSVTRFFASGFFHESVSPQPQSIPLGPFEFFLKIRGDIRK
jgi:hypothetical protein